MVVKAYALLSLSYFVWNVRGVKVAAKLRSRRKALFLGPRSIRGIPQILDIHF